MYQHKPAKVGVSIGVFGIALTSLTTALLLLIPQELMTPATSQAYIETWSRPIMAIGQGVLVYGVPLLSAICAYYLTTKNHSIKSVVTGFIIGGLVLLLGDALLSVTVAHFFTENPGVDRSLISHVSRNIPLGGRLVVGALIGILGATVLKEHF